VSTGFKVLVTLHVLCVMGGFGAVAYNALYASLARRRTDGSGAAVLEVNSLVSGFAELLIYAAFLFGIGAVTASSKTIKFSDAWVSAAFAIYLVDIGILHGWIRRHQKAYAKAVADGGDNVKQLEQKVGFGWGAFNLLVVVAVYLMVFKPGH
jgi:hypothetical protein